MDRHGRQSRLAEVGSAGQQRIAAATVEVRSAGLAAEVATRYLAGAGVGGLRVHEPSLAAVASAVDPTVRVSVEAGLDGGAARLDFSDFRDPVAREVARGASEALRTLRGVLEGGS